MRNKHLHRFTGLVISVFIVAHLINHALAWWGIQTHQAIMEWLRTVYRQPIVEAVLIGAFLFQIYSGSVLLIALKKKPVLTFTERLQFSSGLVFGYFVSQHLVAVIGQRLYYQFDTNFYFAARVVVEYPINLYFVPYYFAGIVAYGIHVALAHRKQMGRSLSPKLANLQFVIIVCMTALLAGGILYTFMGKRFLIVIPVQYKVY